MKYLFLSVLFISFFSCKKESTCPPNLPCATRTGENTFGCYINGKPWVARVGPSIFDPTLHPIEAEYDETGYGNDYQNQLRITASKWTGTSSGFMALYAWPVTTIGLHAGKFSSSGNIDDDNISNQIIVFDLDTIIDYNFDITYLDINKNIISGEFSFKGISSTDTIRVTDGRFDVKYNAF